MQNHEQLNEAIVALCRMDGKPSARFASVLEADPTNATASVALAYMDLYAQVPPSVASARERIAPLMDTAGDDLHLQAAAAWIDGDLQRCLAALAAQAVRDPKDLLALRVGQDIAFYLGDAPAMRDLPGQALGAWDPDDPSIGLVMSMHAFGLEETGELGLAEDKVRHALDLDAGDVWGVHTLAHVLETGARVDEGVAMMADTLADWESSFFATHNYWHHGLFLIAAGDIDGALGLVDGPLARRQGDVWLHLIDVASLLWRLSLEGVDVAERASTMVEIFAGRVEPAFSPFNDLHTAMVATLADRPDVVAELLASRRATGWPDGDSRRARAGMTVIEAIGAFGAGTFDDSADLLASATADAHLIGGSHAQRDVLALTRRSAMERSRP